MVKNPAFPRDAFRCAAMPLDTARAAFQWLVTGPNPVGLDGRLFEGLPDRLVPLDEVRDRLLAQRCPQVVRDAMWAHLVSRSRAEGATWTVGCAGVALPALIAIAARLTGRFAGDRADVHAAILTGFLAELETIELDRPRIMLRLRWAAYRAGHAAVREALDAPVPSGSGFRSSQPRAPWGHPDLVLARAVAEGAITAGEAALIGATRLDGVPLAVAAQRLGRGYEAVKKARLRAERRLVAHLLDQVVAAEDSGLDDGGVLEKVLQSSTGLSGGSPAADGRRRPGYAGAASSRSGPPVARRLSRSRRPRGVQACGRTRARTPSPGRLAITRPSPTPEAPECA